MPMPNLRSTDDILGHVEQTLLTCRRLAPGASVAVVAGLPPGRPGNTNLLKLHRVGG
jgi:pyruvate kinase